ncbi:insulinase family protein, partial [Vibrio parahaemolyticus]|nr:insulinase family protein [Vibrio parahaemolyticus]
SLAEFINNENLESINTQLNALLSQQPSFFIGLGKSETSEQFNGVFAALNSAYLQTGEKPLEMYDKVDGFLKPTQEGSITSMRQEAGGFQVYTLSNGVEVWFQKDTKAGGRAYIYYASQGGKAAVDPTLYAAYEIAATTAIRSGLGTFSGSELDSYLRKNNIALGAMLDATSHGAQITAPNTHLTDALNGLYNLATE